MKLACADWNLVFDIQQGEATVIQIENPLFATELIQDLCLQMNGEDGKIYFSKDGKEWNLSKKGELILNPFSLDFGNRKVQTKLFQEMKEIANDYGVEKFCLLKSEIMKYVDDICSHMQYNIMYDDCFDVLALLKMLGVQLNYSDETFAGTISSYIEIMSQLCGMELFIFVNISQFLSEEQLDYLKKDLAYMNVHIVFIEIRVSRSFDKAVIVDKDLCVIQ